MSRIPMYDPMTSDARSPWLAGLTEACNKLSAVLDMKTATFENLNLPEVYISSTDRYRIYQAPLGNKLWLATPSPVIKKNGNVITPETDGFTIDYLGGSIAFEETYILTEWDVITASATYIVDESNKIASILNSISEIEEEAGKNKGAFDDAQDLETEYPVGTPGDFAIVSSENAIYIWDDTAKDWVNANAKVDLTSYFTKEEINQLLAAKQDKIQEKEISSGSTETATDYFYCGDKTWVNLLSKIRGCALSGLVTNDASQVEEADTLLKAIGKLQAQINGFLHPIIGSNAPTTSTVGIVGQDYINSSNGDKYRLVSIEGSGTDKTYIWQKYGTTSVENFTISIPVSSWSNNACTISNSNIQSGTEYTYFVGPSDSSYKAYNESSIYADDITTNGSITFHASETPTAAISVDICKMNGGTNGKVYNVGGGGTTKDAMTIPGGAEISVSESLGSAPYNIQFNDESISVNGKEIAKKGADGADGKSAYQYAVDGGYTGTEEQFKALMGTGPWLPVAGGIMTGALDMGFAGIEGAKFFGFGFSADTIRPTNGYPLFHATGSYSVKFEGRSGSIVTLQNIKDPVSDTDAANKKYVDDSIASAIDDSWAAAY